MLEPQLSFCPKAPADWVPSGARTACSSQISPGPGSWTAQQKCGLCRVGLCSPAQVNHQHIACAASLSLLFLAPLEVAGSDKSVQSAEGKEAGPAERRGCMVPDTRTGHRTPALLSPGTLVSVLQDSCCPEPTARGLPRMWEKRTLQHTSRVLGPESERCC